MREASQPTILEQIFSNTRFFPYTISQWHKLDLYVRKARILLSFKNVRLKTSPQPTL